MPESLLDLSAPHRAIVLDILQQHVPDREVWAFGSRATLTAKRHSDLDLAVISDEPLSVETAARLADAFSESDLPWRVDVVDWATTGEAFRRIIERDKIVLKGRPEPLADDIQAAVARTLTWASPLP